MATIQGDGFIVNIIKSKRRKTMTLKVDAKGVSAHIPTNLPLASAKKFITQKTNWIQKKLAEQQLRIIPEKQFIDGETFLLLGENYTLRLYDANEKPHVKKTSSDIEFYGRLKRLSMSAIRAAIVAWYKQQAYDHIASRVHELKKSTGLEPRSITIKTYKARWGSCSHNGAIQFNWQLLQAPHKIIDYVILHELCHLTHHNHSPEFWQLVSHFMPDFNRHRDWLKTHGYLLNI